MTSAAPSVEKRRLTLAWLGKSTRIPVIERLAVWLALAYCMGWVQPAQLQDLGAVVVSLVASRLH